MFTNQGFNLFDLQNFPSEIETGRDVRTGSSEEKSLRYWTEEEDRLDLRVIFFN